MPTLRSLAKKFESPQKRILRLSAEGKTEKAVRLIDEKGADLLASRDKEGRTPFFLAALNGHESTARQLLLLGSDPTTPNSAGQTPLRALLALPEPTSKQVRVAGVLLYMLRSPAVDLTTIPSEWMQTQARFYNASLARPPARREPEVDQEEDPTVADEDPRGGRKRTRARKTKRRQTRRRR